MAGHSQIPVDYVTLRNIQLPLPLAVAPDAWNRPNKPQPATISLRVAFPRHLIHEAGLKDSVATTLNYSSLYRVLETKQRAYAQEAAVSQQGLQLDRLLDSIERDVQDEQERSITEIYRAQGYQSPQPFRETEVTLHLPKAVLRAAGGVKCVSYSRQSEWVRREAWIQEIRSYTIIGVNEHERKDKQAVDITLGFRFDSGDNFGDFVNDYHSLTELVADVSGFSFFTPLQTQVLCMSYDFRLCLIEGILSAADGRRVEIPNS